LQHVCLPCGLAADKLTDMDELTRVKRRVPKGAALYRTGNAFESLYAVRSGSFKTIGVSRNGQEKVTGLHLPGEVMGWKRSTANSTATTQSRSRTAKSASFPTRVSLSSRYGCRTCSSSCCAS
jgi:CRP-like cAMP-binding protein